MNVVHMLHGHDNFAYFVMSVSSLLQAPFVMFRSCRGRAVRASDFHTGGPRFEPRPGSSALGQGALSSLPSLSEETLSRPVPCIGEKYPMHVKEPTSLLVKSKEKSRWSGQTVQTGSYIWVVRPTGHSL